MSLSLPGRRLRVGFAGTPEFAAVALNAVLEQGWTVPLVLTQPDRPAGRGLKLLPSPVKELALSRHLAIAQPTGLRLDGRYSEQAMAAQVALVQAELDVMVVAAYGLILPQWVLSVPRWGCLNIHGSLLPRWRGAAPIHRAIEAGDAHTGITLMQMDAGLDTGAMIATEALAIQPSDTTGTLHDALAAMGARLVVDALARLETAPLSAAPQPTQGVTYAHKIDKREAALRWCDDAATLARRIRAFDPFPGATAVMAGETVKLWSATAEWGADEQRASPPGTVLDVEKDALRVAAGAGTVLRITCMQRAGGRRMPVEVLLRGWRVSPGDRFDAAVDAAA
jgi:methionyl-tRNA formyltransferase